MENRAHTKVIAWEREPVTAELIAEFRRNLEERERSAGTIAKYTHDVEVFAEWLGGRAPSKALVNEWKEVQLQSGCAAVTVNGKLTSLNAFFRFLGWDECRVSYFRLQRQIFRPEEKELTFDEYMKLLSTARAKGKERLALLMETICSTGIRVSELLYITLEAVRRGRADISLKGKIRTILLPHKLCRKLKKYAKTHHITSGALFLTKTGRPLSRKQIWAEMKDLCVKAGVTAGKVFPHNLRHLFARKFYQAFGDLASLSDVLGHTSMETTRIYLIATGREHARRLDQLGLVT